MPTPTRHGIVKNITLTFEAADLLEELVPSSRSHGHYLSQLIVADKARREERERLRQVLVLALAETEETAP